MSILVLTDLHSQRSILPIIDRHLAKHKYDAVFMLGDLCNYGDRNAVSYAKDFIDIVKKHHSPLFAIHGNQESDAVKLLYQQENISVHFNPQKLRTPGVHNLGVVGVGYGDSYPSDPEFAKDKILLTHEPPRATTIRQMEALGNIPNAPIAHFSGHLHSIAKVHSIGKTLLVQVPTAQDLRAATFELPSNKVEFISLSAGISHSEMIKSN